MNMIAAEWLPFVSPYIWIMLILNGIALIPTQKKPFTFVKLTVGLFIATLIGWLIAVITVHIMTPIWRVNLLDLSKVILIPTLFAFGLLASCRVLIGDNVLSVIFIAVAKALGKLAVILAPLVPVLAGILAEAFARHAREYPAEQDEQEERERLDRIHINYRGEFSGEYDENKY